MLEVKFKTGDVVIVNTNDNGSVQVMKGDVGVIDQDDSRVPYVKFSFLRNREVIHQDTLELIKRS